jgi:hypothetical protein
MEYCDWNGDCCCGYEVRSFPTKQEKIKALKEYKEALEKESLGVGERIADLEKKK